jgi:hypothetical protein
MLDSLNIALSSVKASGKAETVECSFRRPPGRSISWQNFQSLATLSIFDNVRIYPRETLRIDAGRILRDILDQKTSARGCDS